jgi:hypothetical protein
MESLDKNQIDALAGETGGPCVSMFAPMQVAGRETRQNPIRFKNLLRTAERRLGASSLCPTDAEALIGRAATLIGDETFWQHQDQGLALFLSPEMMREYRLPREFDELVVVGPRFQLTPLVPLFTTDRSFYVLALSQAGVRLLECSRTMARDVTPSDVPAGIQETLELYDEEQHLQFHTGTAATGGQRPAQYHGQGGGEADHKARLLEYFRNVDNALQEKLKGGQSPLVLAAVDYTTAIYREANTYPHLAAEAVTGNPDAVRPQQLRDAAWSIVACDVVDARSRALSAYAELRAHERATSELATVLRAGRDGRIATLLVAAERQQWGSFDETSGELTQSAGPGGGSECLVNLAVVYALRTSAEIVCVNADDLGGAAVAVNLRY